MKRRVCVFAGSATGQGQRYLTAARELGAGLARAGVGVVYGGSSVGTMGALANAALAVGGEVIGVIPRAMVEREIAHTGLTRLEIVTSMHARKALMVELSQSFVALPGGFGTLDELFEITTWAQLGLHEKPIFLCNLDGYFDDLLRFAERAVASGFVRAEHRALWRVHGGVPNLLRDLDGPSEPSS